MGKKGPAGSRNGSMPFTAIAITLLLLAGTYCSVYAYNETRRGNAEDIVTEFDVFDSSVEDLERSVNTGLGNMVSDISKENVPGGVVGLFDEFDRRSTDWLEFMFPLTNGVVSASLLSHDVFLDSESLKIDTGTGSEASTPVFLIARGTVTVKMTSSSGSSTTDLIVNADSLSGLPLVMERSTLLQLAAEGEQSLLNNMISYQLSTLAQYRVLQGYGVKNEYGDMGSRNIITSEDVMNAYTTAMAALETMYYRSNSDGTEFHGDLIDLAEFTLAKDKTLELDLSAIYAQTIASMMDSLVLQWLDYFLTDKILDCIDWMLDRLENLADSIKNALISIANVFRKNDSEKITAGTYLKEVMSEAGCSDSYRYMLSNSSFSLNIMAQDVFLDIPGGPVTVSLPDMECNVPYPNVDVTGWSGWDGFLKAYRNSTNAVSESVKGVLNNICIKLSGSYGLGKISIPVDPYDDIPFTDMLSDIISTTLDEQRYLVEEAAEECFRSEPFFDPMYGCMFTMICDERNDVLGRNALLENIDQQVRNTVLDHIQTESGGVPLDTSFLDGVVKNVIDGEGTQKILENYEKKMNDTIDILGGVLNGVARDGHAEAMKEIFAVIISKGLISWDVFDNIEERVVPLCKEMCDHIASMSAGVIDLPTTSEFIVSDISGNTRSERMDVERIDDVHIDVKPPHGGSMNSHMITVFSDDPEQAPYTAVFVVSIHGTSNTVVRSYSQFSELTGRNDSLYSMELPVDISIHVPVISGWALAGVDYEPSRNILGDIQDALYSLIMKIIEPLIEPLRELLNMAAKAFMKLSSAMLELQSYVTDLIKKLYEMIMGHVEKIKEYVESNLTAVIGPLEGFMKLGLSNQEFGIRFHEFELKIGLNMSDILFKNKTLLSIALVAPLGSTAITAGFEIKKAEKEYSVSGSATLVSDTWNAKIVLDPFMKQKKHIIEMTGRIRDVDFHMTIPELQQYERLDFRLSDIPGVGTMLSNIPLPIPGVKGSIDAGVQLKYNTPYKHGLVINEFESNPKGTDAGNEWVELYNSSRDTLDLEGYKIVPGSGEKKAYTIKGLTISPGEHLVITLPKQILNNSIGVGGIGERVILLDADEKEVDKTPWKVDDKNDEKTWQRSTDGSTEWVFKEHSKGKENGGKLMNGNQVKVLLMQCVVDASVQAFKELGDIESTSDVSSVTERIVQLTIENAIDIIAGCIVEASVFVEIEFSDLTGTGHLGIRLALTAKGDLVENGLTWIMNEIMSMMGIIDNPGGLDPKTILCEDIYIQTTAYTGMSAPRILRGSDLEVRAALVIECNISAVCSLIGKETGRWEVNAGIKIEDIPTALVPAALKTDKDKHADLWLIKAEFQRTQ